MKIVNLVLFIQLAATCAAASGGDGDEWLQRVPPSIFKARRPRYYDSSTTNRAAIELARVNSTEPWPVYRFAKVTGDVILGGLMMVHERSDEKICGPIMPQGGIQALEAMLFTLDKINADPHLLPGFKIGAHILDDCDKDTYGLQQAVDFIRGSINKIDNGGALKCKDGDKPEATYDIIAGVVGASSSVTSIQVANLLRLFKMPMVSFFSTSPELSNKDRFEYFSRTVPSDLNQANAMMELVKLFNWSYISIIYEESSYGIQGYTAVEELAKSNNVCIAYTDKFPKDSTKIDGRPELYDQIVKRLTAKSSARGVILFGSDQEVAELMSSVKRLKLTGKFSWIGSDGWGERELVTAEQRGDQVEGAVTIQPRAHPIKEFADYFLALNLTNNIRNPWFVEYWEHTFKCRVLNSTQTPYNNYTRICTGQESYSEEYPYKPEGQLQFVSDAVMSFAYALRDMHRDVCGNHTGLCAAMQPVDGAKLLKYIRKVNFTGLSGDECSFLHNGDGPDRYKILNYQRTKNGTLKWVAVGAYERKKLKIFPNSLRFAGDTAVIPESVCSQACDFDQAQKFQSGDSCCWICVKCTKYDFMPDRHTCEECPQGTLPSQDLTVCVPIPEEYLVMLDPVALACMAFALLGILATLFVLFVFIKYRDTPVVRAASRELSFVLLVGILLCYMTTYLLIAKPSNIICALQRLAIGFCFAQIYAALLTKTNRIARIFGGGKKKPKRPKCLSPMSQLAICASIVAVQLFITAIWMVVDPPGVTYAYPTREHNQLVCVWSRGLRAMVAWAYPIILIVICTIYAVLTRNIPESFNESKFIGFTMYTTCILFLAFVPIYVTTVQFVKIRIAAMCCSMSLSGTIALLCLFSPKIHIILFRPERNVRQSKTGAKRPLTKHNKDTSHAAPDSADGGIELSSRAEGNNLSSSIIKIQVTVSTQTEPGSPSQRSSLLEPRDPYQHK